MSRSPLFGPFLSKRISFSMHHKLNHSIIRTSPFRRHLTKSQIYDAAHRTTLFFLFGAMFVVTAQIASLLWTKSKPSPHARVHGENEQSPPTTTGKSRRYGNAVPTETVKYRDARDEYEKEESLIKADAADKEEKHGHGGIHTGEV